MAKPKTINALMVHLRSKGLSINGSKQKQILKNIGYYHGYKGYRFVGRASNPINYTNFHEVKAIYDYDSQLKALFYPQIMFIETALKNRVLDIVVNDVGSENFLTIFNSILDDYKRLSLSGQTFADNKTRQEAQKKYDKAVNDRNKLRDNFLKTSSKAYNDQNSIAVHYQQKDQNIPIWGLFEMISLGDFGYFVKISNLRIRQKFSAEFGINTIYDTSAEMPHRIIFALKDLRNAIAHNNIIFDTRFKTAEISGAVKTMLFNETSINVDFKEIFDYLVLIIFVLKQLGTTKTLLKKIINDFKKITELVRNQLPVSIYNMFTTTNLRTKIMQLQNYIKL